MTQALRRLSPPATVQIQNSTPASQRNSRMAQGSHTPS